MQSIDADYRCKIFLNIIIIIIIPLKQMTISNYTLVLVNSIPITYIYLLCVYYIIKI